MFCKGSTVALALEDDFGEQLSSHCTRLHSDLLVNKKRIDMILEVSKRLQQKEFQRFSLVRGQFCERRSCQRFVVSDTHSI